MSEQKLLTFDRWAPKIVAHGDMEWIERLREETIYWRDGRVETERAPAGEDK